jgi:hypothetical protein
MYRQPKLLRRSNTQKSFVGVTTSNSSFRGVRGHCFLLGIDAAGDVAGSP